MRLIIATILIACLVVTTSVVGQDTDSSSTNKYYVHKSKKAERNHFALGMGLTFSSAYSDALQKAQPQYDWSGSGAWIYMDLGFAFRIATRTYLTPRVGMLATFIEYQNSLGLPSSMNSKKATILFLPAAGVKHEFSPSSSTLFAAADLGIVAPVSDLEFPKLESGGLAFGFGVGYSFSREYELALTYRYVPIKTGSVYYDPWDGTITSSSESTNYGGIGISFWRLWSI